MKNSVIVFAVFCGLIAGAIVYLNRSKPATNPAPIVAVASALAEQGTPDKIAAPAPATPPPVSVMAAPPAPVVVAPPVENVATNSNSIGQMVDALLTAKSAAQKHDLFQQLIKSGQIEAAIAELKARAADHPDDAGIPTTLGEAQLNQLRALRDAGGDYNQIGILAMQADQSFNAALKVDPSNWEAQFVKASSMYYWPADTARDNDVVQRLASLIDQQEKMPVQPEFAQTYVVLGNQYQKIGRTDYALQTWRLGAQKFPDNTALQKKISGQ